MTRPGSGPGLPISTVGASPLRYPISHQLQQAPYQFIPCRKRKVRPDWGSNPGLPGSGKDVLPLRYPASSWRNHQLQHFLVLLYIITTPGLVPRLRQARQALAPVFVLPKSSIRSQSEYTTLGASFGTHPYLVPPTTRYSVLGEEWSPVSLSSRTATAQ